MFLARLKKFLDAYLGSSCPICSKSVSTDGEVFERGRIRNFARGPGLDYGWPLYVIQIKGDARQVVVGDQEELYTCTLRVRRTILIRWKTCGRRCELPSRSAIAMRVLALILATMRFWRRLTSRSGRLRLGRPQFSMMRMLSWAGAGLLR